MPFDYNKIPLTCIVPHCTTSQIVSFADFPGRFFPFPQTSNEDGKEITQIKQHRREAWISTIQKHNKDALINDTEYMIICYKHFVSGSPSSYYDVMNVDWLPTLHLKDPSTSVEDATSEENEPKLDANTTSEQAFRILTKINESQRQEFSDTFNIFGQHVANKLRTYPHRTRCDVQHKINEILYEADMSFYEVGKVVAEQMSQQQQQQSQQQQSSSKSTKRQRTSTKRVSSNAPISVPALNLTNKGGEGSLLQTALAAASAINSQPKKIKMERKSPTPEVLNLRKTTTSVEVATLSQVPLTIGAAENGNKPTSGIFYIQHRPSSGQSNCVEDEEDDPILPSQSEL